jgi:hypothetical protein
MIEAGDLVAKAFVDCVRTQGCALSTMISPVVQHPWSGDPRFQRPRHPVLSATFRDRRIESELVSLLF